MFTHDPYQNYANWGAYAGATPFGLPNSPYTTQQNPGINPAALGQISGIPGYGGAPGYGVSYPQQLPQQLQAAQILAVQAAIQQQIQQQLQQQLQNPLLAAVYQNPLLAATLQNPLAL